MLDTEELCSLIDISNDPLYELSAILVLYTGLELIWRRRQEKKSTSLYETRAELECLISTLRRSRIKALKEAGNMVENTLNNFPFNSKTCNSYSSSYPHWQIDCSVLPHQMTETFHRTPGHQESDIPAQSSACTSRVRFLSRE